MSVTAVVTADDADQWWIVEHGGTEARSVESRFRVSDFAGRVAAVTRAAPRRSSQVVSADGHPELENDLRSAAATIAVKRVPEGSLPSYVVLQEWEGVVHKIECNILLASLRDISRGEQSMSNWAEIPLEELPDQDRVRVEPGTIFRWALGYRHTAGVRERFSRIVVRHLPAWTKRNLEEAERFADQYGSLLVPRADGEFGRSSGAG